MKISKHDANLLLILLGIVIFLSAYFAIYRPYQSKAEEATAEISSLKPKLKELQGYYDQLDTFLAGIESEAEAIEGEMARYPTAVRTEDLVMYAISMEEEIGLDVTRIDFEDAEPLRQFDSVTKDGEAYTLTPLTAYRCVMTASCNLTYGELKDLIRFVNETAERTALDNVSVSFDSESGKLVGSVTCAKYFIASGSEAYTPTKVPPVKLGTDDIFGTFTVTQEP